MSRVHPAVGASLVVGASDGRCVGATFGLAVGLAVGITLGAALAWAGVVGRSVTTGAVMFPWNDMPLRAFSRLTSAPLSIASASLSRTRAAAEPSSVCPAPLDDMIPTARFWGRVLRTHPTWTTEIEGSLFAFSSGLIE